MNLGGAAFGGDDLSSDEGEPKPHEYDFGTTLASGIWGSDTTSANLGSNIWGTPQPATNASQPPGNSDAVADDWVSKSLDTPFNPGDSSLWGSSLGANPWMAESSSSEQASSHRLWAPTTDYDTYKSRVLQSLCEDANDPSSHTWWSWDKTVGDFFFVFCSRSGSVLRDPLPLHLHTYPSS